MTGLVGAEEHLVFRFGVRINEDPDNRGSDNRGCIVLHANGTYRRNGDGNIYGMTYAQKEFDNRLCYAQIDNQKITANRLLIDESINRPQD